jgi:UDP-N-acetylmuramoyl-tripeptide--D-alanyl-D-alanine ligase
MKKTLIQILRILSKLVLKKYKPEVIAITGSVGKTSSKEVIAQILATKFKIRKTSSNYNNEIGVPLTILGINKSPGKNILAWIPIFLKSLGLLILPTKYPQKLVLEFGADHKGDIEYLVQFIPVYIGVLTRVSKVHMQYFKTLGSIFNEKKKIFSKINPQGWAVINNDDDLVKTLKKELSCKTIGYGIKNESDIQASDLQLINRDGVIGMNFKLKYQGNVVPVFLPQTLGFAQVYAFLSGASIALQYGFNLVEISAFAGNYRAPKGRTNLIKGINNSYIIDDSYNSSPEAVKMSLDLLSGMQSFILGKRIAVLGDMLELGRESVPAHKEIGEYVVHKKIDILLTTGDISRNTYLAAQKLGMSDDNNKYFKDKEELIYYLKSIIKNDDLILIKGSQGSRMEEIVKCIMKELGRAKDLLVRQSSTWIK